MNIHVPEGMQVPDFVPTFDTEGGFISITLNQNNRLALETTVERLINMLDDMDAGTEDLEPYLAGWHGGNPSQDDREADYEGQLVNGDSDFEPSLGWTECIDLRSATKSTGHIADIDLEEACEDEGAQCDDEGAADTDAEYELGWTDYIDQDQSVEDVFGCGVRDGEPSLGFTGHGTGWRPNEVTDDREFTTSNYDGEGDDADREPLLGWTEASTSGNGEDDADGRANAIDPNDDDLAHLGFTGAGYSVHKAELKRIKATKDDATNARLPERVHIMPDGKEFRTFVHAHPDDFIPELDHRAHYLAAHGLRPN